MLVLLSPSSEEESQVLEHGSMPSILPSTIVTVWASSKDVPRVLKRGYRIVHAAADYFYLDCGQGGWIGKEGGGNSWCDPFKSWARMYSSVRGFPRSRP